MIKVIMHHTVMQTNMNKHYTLYFNARVPLPLQWGNARDPLVDKQHCVMKPAISHSHLSLGVMGSGEQAGDRICHLLQPFICSNSLFVDTEVLSGSVGGWHTIPTTLFWPNLRKDSLLPPSLTDRFHQRLEVKESFE